MPPAPTARARRAPLLAALGVVFAACAPAARGPAAPAPVLAPTTAPAPRPAARDTANPAPDWHLLDPATDSVPGTGAARALRELLANRRPQREVVVAVIDGGVDTAHAALRGVLWSNPRETPNRIDDDGDGLVDDTRGWNYIGYANGRSIDYERLELTRLVARCRAARGAPTPPPELIAGVGATCVTLEARYDSARTANASQLAQYADIGTAFDSSTSILAGALRVPRDSVTPARVRAFEGASGVARRARALYLQLADNGITAEALREGRKSLQGLALYGYNPSYDPRPAVGDLPAAGRRYGNADVTGPDPRHGTHVAGIIGAAPNGGGAPTVVGRDAAVRPDSGARGVAPAGGVRIMGVRATPNGDERDKDVANAIRYAVDHGALVVNMSFGKGYSPEKAVVDSAVRYAESRGVLLVHAAGNDASDNDRAGNFPSPGYLGAPAGGAGGRAANWLEVGASTFRRDRLPARFSNYGRTSVDLFAPGQDVLSTLPGNTYGRESGTSMAAPVVSGVAALLLSYFPRLTPADVRRLLLATATRYPNLTVARPGDEARVPFATLSVSGGVVNAYEAVRAALAEEAGRPATP
jgi:subtilisin family serine protease